MRKPREHTTSTINEFYNPGWYSHGNWRRRLTIEEAEQLDQFLLYLHSRTPDREPYSSHTAWNYWCYMRQAMTVYEDLTDLVVEASNPGVEAVARHALAAWADFVGGEEGEELVQFLKDWKAEKEEPRPRGGRRAQNVRPGLRQEDLRRLRKRADEDADPTAIVLGILTRTGLRVGDVLRIEREAVLEGLPVGEMLIRLKGGKVVLYPVRPIRAQLEALLDLDHRWRKVQEHFGSGTYRAATGQLSKRLREYTLELGIRDVYLHRIRASVITAVANTSGLREAQAIAAHSRIATTERYLQGPPPTDVQEEALMKIQ